MGFREGKSEKEVEWDKNWGYMTQAERTTATNKLVSDKLSTYREKHPLDKVKIDLPYPEIIKGLNKSANEYDTLKKSKKTPDDLRMAKKKALSEEYDKVVITYGITKAKELWVSERLGEYTRSDEYVEAKENLQDALNNYSKYTALKEYWEKENISIIEAEKIRSKRAELMQADPETLKALGITPDPTFTAPKAEVKTEDPCAINVDALLPKFMENHGYK